MQNYFYDIIYKFVAKLKHMVIVLGGMVFFFFFYDILNNDRIIEIIEMYNIEQIKTSILFDKSLYESAIEITNLLWVSLKQDSIKISFDF